MNTQFKFDEAVDSKIVYIRPVSREELPQDVQDEIGEVETVYSVHKADGAPVALVQDRATAFVLARQHDFAPVSVH